MTFTLPFIGQAVLGIHWESGRLGSDSVEIVIRRCANCGARVSLTPSPASNSWPRRRASPPSNHPADWSVPASWTSTPSRAGLPVVQSHSFYFAHSYVLVQSHTFVSIDAQSHWCIIRSRFFYHSTRDCLSIAYPGCTIEVIEVYTRTIMSGEKRRWWVGEP